MKRIFQIVAALAISTCLFSCHKEITIPDPGFDMSETVLDTIRRDTSDVYKIAFTVKAPNGVQYIQLLNGRNFEVVKEFDEYNGKTNFTFSHEFDLSNVSYDQDSLFVYNIKIRTNDNRGYNKSIRIQQLKKSHPEIEGPSSTLNVLGRAFVFDGNVDTGYYTIESINISLNGSTLKTIGADELDGVAQYRLYHKLTYDFVPGEKYTYTVTVKDSRGEEKSFSYNLVGTAVKKPVAIKYSYGTTQRAAILHYNDQGLVEAYFEPYSSELVTMQYDDEGRMRLSFRSTTAGIGPACETPYGNGSIACWYTYNEDGSIKRYADFGYNAQVGGTIHKLLDPWWLTPDLIPESCQVSDLAGTEVEGHVTRITGYNDYTRNTYKEYGGRKYNVDLYGTSSSHIGPIQYLEDFEEGLLLPTMILGSGGQGVHPFYGFAANRWCEIKSFVPVLNPLYVKDMPPYLHMRYNGTMRMQMFGFKYVATSCERPANGESGLKTIPYTVREDGLLKSFGATFYAVYPTYKYQYTYYYDDEPEDAWRPYLNATIESIIDGGYLK